MLLPSHLSLQNLYRLNFKEPNIITSPSAILFQIWNACWLSKCFSWSCLAHKPYTFHSAYFHADSLNIEDLQNPTNHFPDSFILNRTPYSVSVAFMLFDASPLRYMIALQSLNINLNILQPRFLPCPNGFKP